MMTNERIVSVNYVSMFIACYGQLSVASQSCSVDNLRHFNSCILPRHFSKPGASLPRQSSFVCSPHQQLSTPHFTPPQLVCPLAPQQNLILARH